MKYPEPTGAFSSGGTREELSSVGSVIPKTTRSSSAPTTKDPTPVELEEATVVGVPGAKVVAAVAEVEAAVVAEATEAAVVPDPAAAKDHNVLERYVHTGCQIVGAATGMTVVTITRRPHSNGSELLPQQV